MAPTLDKAHLHILDSVNASLSLAFWLTNIPFDLQMRGAFFLLKEETIISINNQQRYFQACLRISLFHHDQNEMSVGRESERERQKNSANDDLQVETKTLKDENDVSRSHQLITPKVQREKFD